MKEASLDHWTVLFLFAAAQGLFLAFILWVKKGKTLNYLSLAVAFFSIMLLYYVAFWTGYYLHIGRWAGAATGLTYLFIPLLYHYSKHSEKQIGISLSHFIPFIVFLFYFFSLPYLDRSISRYISITANLLQCTHAIVYAFLFLKIPDQPNEKRSFQKFVTWSYLGFALNFIAYYVLVWTGLWTLEFDYLISAASAVLIYGIGYHVFVNPVAFSEIISNKYRKSALTPAASLSIMNRITELMELEKPYLDNDLTLSSLAGLLGQSPNHVSQVINEQSGKNFSDFINSYRIHEARILIETSNVKPKFINVAYEVGFNNKTSFYNAFKKIANCSPSDYYSNLHAEKVA